MRLRGLGIDDVQDLDAAAAQDVSDDHPVALPPEQLRAHDRRAFPGCAVQQLRQSGGKLLGLRIVRVAAERGAAPLRVRRILPRRPASAQPRNPEVAEAVLLERLLQRLAAELRVAARAGVAPYV